jgi:hypothetical protein
MNNATRTMLDDIRRRDNALGQVASRSEAEAALNDCRTLLTIIDGLQAARLRTGTSYRLRRQKKREACCHSYSNGTR